MAKSKTHSNCFGKKNIGIIEAITMNVEYIHIRVIYILLTINLYNLFVSSHLYEHLTTIDILTQNYSNLRHHI